VLIKEMPQRKNKRKSKDDDDDEDRSAKVQNNSEISSETAVAIFTDAIDSTIANVRRQACNIPWEDIKMTWTYNERKNLVELILEVIELSKQIDLSPLIWQETMLNVCRELTFLLHQNDDTVATKLIEKLQYLKNLMLNQMQKRPLKHKNTIMDTIKERSPYPIPAIISLGMTFGSVAIAASTADTGEIPRMALYIAMNVGVSVFSHHLIRIISHKLRSSGIPAPAEALANVAMNAVFMNYINASLGVGYEHTQTPGFDFAGYITKFDKMCNEFSWETADIFYALGKQFATTITTEIFINARERLGLPGLIENFKDTFVAENVPIEWARQFFVRAIYLNLSPKQDNVEPLLIQEQVDPIKLLSGLFLLQKDN
jgi:hypothetical protein